MEKEYKALYIREYNEKGNIIRNFKGTIIEDTIISQVQKANEILKSSNYSIEEKISALAKRDYLLDYQSNNYKLLDEKYSKDIQIGEIRKSNHTKYNYDIWVVKPNIYVPGVIFEKLKERASINKGYYSTFKDNIGFIFKTETDAQTFNTLSIVLDNINNVQIPNEIKEDIHQNYTAQQTIENDINFIEEVEKENVVVERKDEFINNSITLVDNITLVAEKEISIIKPSYYEEEWEKYEFDYNHDFFKVAVKQAKSDINRLAKRIAKDLGVKSDVANTKANISNLIGGNIFFHIPLEREKELFLSAKFNAGFYIEQNRDFRGVESLNLDSVIVRVESPKELGANKYGKTYKYNKDVSYIQLINDIKNITKEYVKAYQYDLFFSPVEDNNIVTEIKPDIISNIQARIEIEEDKQIDQNNKQEENNNINNNDYGSNTIKSMEGRVQSSSTEMDTEVRGQTDRGLDKGRMDSSNDGLYELDQNGSRGLSATPTTETIEPIIITEKKNQDNYRFTGNREDFPASASERYKDNIEAIKLLHTLESENRQATTEEQDILSKYSGWGGLGTYFDKNDSPWNKNALNRILTAEEYQSAELSRNSAYYTPDYVCDALWNIASSLGFKGGNILEGSAGTGKILSRIPEDINANSDIQAVEIDDITGRILSNLYPNANVNIQGFQATRIENNSVDLAITNVPFVHDLHVKDNIDRDLSDKFKDVGTFCLAKNIRKLKEGGLGIFITTSSTLDNNRAFRNWVTTDANSDFIGAFRLHSKTFNGTLVTSDILVVRKRINGIKSEQAIDVLNTSVVREVEIEIEKGKDKTEIITRNLDYNTYFVENPDKMGGQMMFASEYKENTYRPTSKHLYPSQDINQKELLLQWSKSFKEEIIQNKVEEKEVKEINTIEYEKTIVKEGALLLNSNNEICISRGGEAVILGVDGKKVKGRPKSEVLTDYLAIKSSLDDCIIFQQNNTNDEELKIYIAKLNEAYDNFVYKYGQLNENRSISFLKKDVDFPTITAIELYSVSEDINGKQKIHTEKTNVFKERVIGVIQKPIIKDIKDGVIWSYQQFGKIDVNAISNILNISNTDVRKYVLDNGFAFINPLDNKLQIRHEYLSGNVREKLYYALENNSNGEYDNNIKELSKVIPMNIPAHSIEFTLGSTWLDSSLYEEFAKQTYEVDIKLININSYWHLADDRYKYIYINERNKSKGVFSTLLDEHIPGHELFLAAINNKQYRVSKVDYSTKEVRVDKEATKTCQDRIDEIKEEFKEWARQKMLDDPKLAEKIEKVYNDKFNSIVPIKIDKQFLQPYLNGMSHINPLYQHQQEAIVRSTMKPTMLAHEVGTGKTYTLIASAMEMKRLGMAKKPMIVVQNATTGQFVSQAKTLYPGARILTVTDTDKTPEGRLSFYAKIKYNDWDLIIIPQSVFNMIPDSEDRIRSFIQEKIDETRYALSQAREADIDKRRIKEMENQIQVYEKGYSDADLSIISSTKKKKTDGKKEAIQRENAILKAEGMVERKIDNTDTFDEMGIDALLIDEAHNYKHLGFPTTMTRGIKGIDPTYSQRAVSLYLKIQSIYERVGYKNVVMATGTPISNTAGEIWTFMRYLMPKEELQKNHIYYFDDFVHNFGNISQSLEFATNGKYKLTTRFASYINMPELMRMWCSVSDTVLSKNADYVNSKIPKTENGYYNEQNIWVNKPQDIFLPQSNSLIRITDAVKKELLRFEEMSPREKRENTHIPLTMFGIAKKAAIDTRLVDKHAPDEECSKTNHVVKDIISSIEETNEYKGTVAVFCDIYRRYDFGVEAFNLFEDIKTKLINSGRLREDEIVIMKSGMSQNVKEKIFQRVNEGDVRVILGTSENLGTGVNIQKRLHTLIHIDAPARPMDYTQRNGRILRQGNMHKDWDIPVRILRYGVEDSLDITGYQRLQTKENFINEVMDNEIYLKNNQINRVIEEAEEGQFDNPVAQLSGSQFALKKQQAERIFKKLKSRETNYKNDQKYIESQLRKNTSIINSNKDSIKVNTNILSSIKELFPEGKVSRLVINGIECLSQKDIENAFVDINKETNAFYETFKNNHYNKQTQHYTIELNNTKVNINYDCVASKYFSGGMTLTDYHRNISYEIPELEYSAPVQGQWIKRVYNDILSDVITGKHFTERIEYAQRVIDRLENENAIMLERRGKPFEFSAELAQAKLDVDRYDNLMKEELEEKDKKYEARLKENEENSNIEEVNLQQIIDDEIEAEEQLYTESNYDKDDFVVKSVTENLLDLLSNSGIDVHILNESDNEYLLEEIKTTTDKICGFTSGSTIYLTPNGINPETPIHEYTHLWCKVMELTKPEFWTNVIVPYLKGSPVWNEVLADKRYSKIHDNDSRMASEVIARVSGRIGAKKLIKYAKETINESNEKHRGIKATIVNNMRKAVQKFWTMVKNHIFKKPKYSIEEECIADMVVNDLIAGETVNETTLNVIEAGLETRQKQYISISESQLDYLNNKFNEELEKQINGTLPNNHIYKLGLPSKILLSSGIPSLPLELASSRLADKGMQANHPFDISEIKNLVNAVQEPMAVFRSATHLGSFVILTEIEHQGRNFVVAIQTNKIANKLLINSIRSIHYRNNNSHIALWLQKNLAEYVDKEKMSRWLSKQQYNSADVKKSSRHVAKIIQNFENPILEEEKNKIFNNIDDIEFQFKQDYCNNFKQLDFKELKSKIKITEFAEYIGYKLRKDKTTHKHLIYEHSSGEKICIYNNPDGKPQIYMTIGGLNADKGDIISFVKNKIDNGIINKPINGTSPFEKVNILLHEYLNIPFEDRKVYNSLDEYIQKSKQNLFISDYQPYTGNITIKAVEYMSTRGLDSNDFLIYPFRGSVVGTNTAKIEADINKIPNNQVAFPLYDKNEKMVGVQLVSENYKSFLKGSRKSVGVWHSNIPEKINNIVICEAPLDAISYHKLQGDSNTLYFATCGNVTDGQLDAIKSIIENNKNVLAANYTITLANDNDAAGTMFNLNYILSTLDEKGNTNIHFNNTKDGRCDLMISLSSADTNNLLKLYDNLPKEDINLEIKAKDGVVNILYSKDIKTISALNDLLLTSKPQNIKIDVPITKDYNEDLKTLQHINSLSSDKYSYQDVKHNSFLFTDDISKFHKDKKKHRGVKF